jgi:hypothetical protein
LKQDFTSGKSVRKHTRFAGKVRYDNIDPEIRKYIGFDFFPSAVQERFLDEVTEGYITKLKNGLSKINIVDKEPDGSSDYYIATDEVYAKLAEDVYANLLNVVYKNIIVLQSLIYII